MLALANQTLSGIVKASPSGETRTEASQNALRGVLAQLRKARELYSAAQASADELSQLDIPTAVCLRALGEDSPSDQLFEQMSQSLFPSASPTGNAAEDLPQALAVAKMRAMQLLKAGQPPQALAVLTEALQWVEEEAAAGRLAVAHRVARELIPLYEQAGTIAAQQAAREGHPAKMVDAAARLFTQGLAHAFTAAQRHRMLLFLGEMYERARRWEEAAATHEALLRSGEEKGDSGVVWHALDRRGEALAALGRVEEAVACHERCLEAAEGLGELRETRRAQISALTTLGALYERTERVVECFAALNRALRLAREGGEPQHGALLQLGRAQLSRGMAREAAVNLRMAGATAGDAFSRALALAHLGEALDEQGDVAAADDALQEALRACGEGCPDVRRVALTNLGKVWNRRCEPQRALEYLRESAEINERLKDPVGLLKALSVMVTSHRGLHQDKEARLLVLKCHALQQQLDQRKKS